MIKGLKDWVKRMVTIRNEMIAYMNDETVPLDARWEVFEYLITHGVGVYDDTNDVDLCGSYPYMDIIGMEYGETVSFVGYVDRLYCQGISDSEIDKIKNQLIHSGYSGFEYRAVAVRD